MVLGRYFDRDTYEELIALQDEEEIKDRFYRTLEFGTGGLRGVIAFDSRRMSPEFAREAALCLNANGIRAFIRNRA